MKKYFAPAAIQFASILMLIFAAAAQPARCAGPTGPAEINPQPLPVVATLDLLTTPTLGGIGTAIWCAASEAALGPVELVFTLETPWGGPEMPALNEPYLVDLTRGVADQAFSFKTPVPGNYRITAEAVWRDARGELTHTTTLALAVAPDGTVRRLPDAPASEMNKPVAGLGIVTYPSVKGYRFHVGSTIPITWTGFSGAYVNISIYNSGVLVATIAKETANDGRFDWTIPETFSPLSAGTIRVASTTILGNVDFSDFPFAITNPRLTAPNASNLAWVVGNTYAITWTGLTGSSVRIDLYNGDDPSLTIALSAPNTGSYNWRPLTTMPLGAGYYIQVISNTNNDQTRMPLRFTLCNPKLNFPNATNITLMTGYRYPLTWSGIVAYQVNIDLMNNGLKVLTIARAVPNSGSYNWTLPSVMSRGGLYKIRISPTSGAQQIIQSANPFWIISPAVISPVTNDAWHPGSAYDIRWSGLNGAQVMMRLYRGSTLVQTIVNPTANDGVYRWTVPSGLVQAENYYIWIWPTNDGGVFAVSNPFSIGTPRVTYPNNSGVVLRAGTNYTLTWASFNGSTVRIELLRGTTVAQTISTSAPNNGYFFWYAPTSLTPASDYKIRVSSLNPAGQTDMSDNAFTFLNPRVLYPTNYISVRRGSAMTVRWSGYTGAQVRIELMNGETRVTSLDTANDGSNSFTIPSSAAPGTSYSIVIRSVSDLTLVNSVKNRFTVTL